MKAFATALLALALLGAGGPACAAEASRPAPTPNTPVAVSTRTTTISVSHEGGDSLGARLATRLKELFNTSNLFRLDAGDGARIGLQLRTSPEFAERPGMGSVYSLVWLFLQDSKTLGNLLADEVGTFTGDQVDELAYKIVERTDGLSVKYGYLFQR